MKFYPISWLNRSNVTGIAAVCCALLFCSLTASAQQGKGTISGTVADQTGAAVPGAAVTIINTGTNATFTATTNQEGFYIAPGLAVGSYRVVVERQGFRQAVLSQITLQVDQKAQVDVTLETGNLSETMEVTAQAPLTDTGSATLGKVIENRRMVELPINGRNALALVVLTPGVKSNAGPTNSGFGDRGLQISNISINGSPNSMNGNTIDGGTNVQAFVGEVNISPSVDAIQEFKVQSSVMSAEFGFTAGGVVNIVTKSGTNQLHGTVYEFLRNDVFDARNAFSDTKPPLRYNQFGASAGGPVIRDRTFYFGNWEEYRLRRAFPLTTTVPTEQMRRGDFSDFRDSNGRLIPIYDPATTRANPNGSGFIRDQFQCRGRLNVICPERLDPVALNIQKFYPLPNRAPTDPFTNSNNYQNLAGSRRDMRQYTVKLDHRLTKQNTLTGRYAYYGHVVDDASAGPVVWPDPVVSRRDDDLRNHNFLLSDTHAFSPTLLHEFRGGLTASRLDFVVRSAGGDWPRKLGLPESVPNEQFPQISNGLAAFQGASIGYRHSLAWHFYDALTKIQGSHTLKFGVDYRINIGFQNQKGATSGAFNFTAGLTGNPQNQSGTGSAYATFLAGAVASASISTHLGQTPRNHSLSFFFQDDWKATRRLTLNLGLRYDFQQQPYEVNNGLSNFDSFSIDPNTGLRGRTVFAGVDGQPRSFRKNDYTDFGPRIGFAYDLFGKGRTVLRGGYAIFYPYLFIRQTHGRTAGFSSTPTSYTAAGGANFPAFQLKDGLPRPPIQPLGAALGPSAFLGQSVNYDEPDGRSPYSQQYSLTAQQQLPGAWLVEATYSANLGHHFIAGGYDLNQLDPKYNSLGLALQDRVPNPYAGKVPGALGAATITRAQSLRPYPYYDAINVLAPR
ncbi:MAG: carboxypeptidase regulatory-like domain-containing protein, partial [Blastocatellia bacterium]